MPASRTGLSTLRAILRQLCKLTVHFPALLANPDIPAPVSLAVAALVTACLASSFEDPHSGEISGQAVIITG
jgi:hypothetical protein